jgi:hypothetical protein
LGDAPRTHPAFPPQTQADAYGPARANFVGWDKDYMLFDRELEKVIRALRTGEGGREKPPPRRLWAAGQAGHTPSWSSPEYKNLHVSA